MQFDRADGKRERDWQVDCYDALNRDIRGN
jgi:hypothetical protein